MTPQDLTSAYIAPTEFGYAPSGPSAPYATHHHPLSVGSGGCPSSQQSSDDDLTFYSNSLVGSESGNVTTSLYGLVTGNPSCFTSSTTPPSSSQPHPHPHQYSPHHLHPTHNNHSHIHTHHSHQNNNHHHHHQHNPPSSRSSHPASSSASSSHSHTSYAPLPAATPPRGSGLPRVMSDSPSFKHLGPHHHHNNRKRKSPVPRVESDEDSETCSSRRTATPTDENSKKQNHSEIEKRRRDKMNLYIAELSGMVPMCSAMSRKLDKLTVLRMAVQHMKTLRGSRIHSYTEGTYKPSFLTDDELKHLILQSAEGFLFVVGCDRGRLLYVSESVAQVLNHSQSDLLGQSWFDILHPKDVAKVKEQLSSSDLAPRERLIDAKTMLPVKGNVPQKANRLCPGARRSFFCRMKVKNAVGVVKEEVVEGCGGGRRKKGASDRKYSVIHCTGYLKSWAKVGMEDAEGGESEDPCNLSCLVAVGRNLNPIASPSPNPQHRPVTFISRHAIDGKFLFVDQRTTLVVGFLPQELLGTSVYEYFHQEDIQLLADVHKHVLLTHEPITTQLYRFRTRAGPFVKLTSNWKAFRNPWTREIECIIAKNTLAPEHNATWTFTSYHDFLDVDDDCADGSDSCREDGGTTRRPEAFNHAPEFDFFGGESQGGRLSPSSGPFGGAGGGGGGGGIGNQEIHRLIHSEVPCRKIGEQIAEEVIEGQRRSDSSSSSPVSNVDGLRGSASPVSLGLSPSAAPTHSPFSTHQGSSPSAAAPGTNGLNSPIGEGTGGGGGSSQSEGAAEGLTLSCRTNDPIIGASAAPMVPSPRRTLPLRPANEQQGEEEMLYMIGESVLPESPHEGAGDGNDEAAMAVIMSLLEADAGLGGPVDFSGLPWPLP